MAGTMDTLTLDMATTATDAVVLHRRGIATVWDQGFVIVRPRPMPELLRPYRPRDNRERRLTWREWCWLGAEDAGEFAEAEASMVATDVADVHDAEVTSPRQQLGETLRTGRDPHAPIRQPDGVVRGAGMYRTAIVDPAATAFRVGTNGRAHPEPRILGWLPWTQRPDVERREQRARANRAAAGRANGPRGGRPRSCECGECERCQARERQRASRERRRQEWAAREQERAIARGATVVASHTWE